MGIYTAAVQKLYVAYFNRPADFLGLQYWEGVVAANNGSTALISDAFSKSQEYIDTYAGMTNAQIVNQVYLNLFGRGATDVAGLTFWSNHLTNGTLSVSNVVTAIAAGAQGSDLTAYNNKVTAATAFTAALDTSAEVIGYSGVSANLLAKTWMNTITNDASLLAATAPTALNAAVATVVGGAQSGATVMLTTGIDNFDGVNAGGLLDDLYIGTKSSTFLDSGTSTTFNPGDAINGGEGENTLRLFMDPSTIADDVSVTNIQNLDLRLTGNGDSPAELRMTDWDDSLQQIDIRSNRSEISITDQKTLADISIRDQSTASTQSSYEFGYAEDVVDGDNDTLNLSVDNVNGEDGAYVGIDAGIEGLNITVNDRAGDEHDSDINLYADGVVAIDVTGGRDDRNFELEAFVASGADFDSTTFVGDMTLSSGDVKTARFGAGDDVATITGQADEADSSYNLGAGDNEIDVLTVLGGSIVAGDGDDDAYIIHSTADGSSINLGAGDNDVFVAGSVAGSITTTTGDDLVIVGSTASTGSINVGAGANEAFVGAHAGSFVSTTGDDSVTASSTAEGSVINVGAGANEVIVNGEHAGSIVGTTGVDSVEVWSTATTGSIDVGAGANYVCVDGDHLGAITGADGDNVVEIVGDIGAVDAAGSLTLGDGDNTVTVGDVAVFGFHLGGGDVAFDSAIVLGDGDNLLTINDINDGASVSLGGGDNVVSFNDMNRGASLSFGDGDNLVGRTNNSARVNIGSSEGTYSSNVKAGYINDATITFGDGDNTFVAQELEGGTTATFGDGDNTLVLTEYIQDGSSATLGDGDNYVNTRRVERNSSLALGDGDNDIFILEEVGNDATVTTGDGDNNVFARQVRDGASVTLGSGDDAFQLGYTVQNGSARVDSNNPSSVNKQSTISMGAGDDVFTIMASCASSLDDIVESGGLVDGGEGVDVLTLNAKNSVFEIVDRTENQEGTIDFSEETFVVGDVVTVTFTRGTETFSVSHTVSDDDFVQGADNVATKVADSVRVKLNANDDFNDLFGAIDNDAGKVTIESINPLMDFDITSNRGSVEVEQISDARITDFETLNLVVLNETDLSDDVVEIGADFDLIDGTSNINLDSRPELEFDVFDSESNGSYTEYSAGRISEFTLSNLKGGEVITVAGHEVGEAGFGEDAATGTGNQQVDRITVDTTAGRHVIGDTITVTFGEVEVVYVVTANDLIGDTAAIDAANIATSLASAIGSAAVAAGFAVEVDDNLITLIHQTPGVSSDVGVFHDRPVEDGVYEFSGDDFSISDSLVAGELQAGDVFTVEIDGQEDFVYTVSQEDCERLEADALINAIVAHFGDEYASFDYGSVRFSEVVNGTVTRALPDEPVLGGTSISNLQEATSTDDSSSDVVINTSLIAGAVNTTMDLTIDGYGSFDVSLFGMGSDDANYTDLDLKLADSFSHTIYADGETHFQDSITISDVVGVNTAGADIVLEDVGAATVTSTSKANITIDQDAGEAIDVTTGTGDDHLTTRGQDAIASGSSIDLGAGENTLSLDWDLSDGDYIDSSDLEAIGGIDYSGDLTQLDILSYACLDQDLTILTMPSGVDGVEVINFEGIEVEGEGAADFTIVGAANDLSVAFEEDFYLGVSLGVTLGSDDEVIDEVFLDGGLFTVTDGSDVEITGSLEIAAGNGVLFNIGNNSLDTLTVSAGEDVEVFISGNSDAEFDIGDVVISSGLGEDDVVDFVVSLNVDTDVTLGDIALTGVADADLVFEYNSGLAAVIGDVTIASTSDADVQVDDNEDSVFTFGHVTIEGGNDTNELIIEDNTAVVVTVASVDIVSLYEAQIDIVNNSDSSVTILGDISLKAADDWADLHVDDNVNTNVSLSVGGMITLVSCDYQAHLSITGNVNSNDPLLGGPDPDPLVIHNYAVSAGDLSVNADDQASLYICNNADETYFGNLTVSVGNVDLFSHDYTCVSVECNDASTVVMLDIDMVSQNDAELKIRQNDGTFYDISFNGADYREFDNMEVDVGDVSMVADYTCVCIDENELIDVTIGNVDLVAESDADFDIDGNDVNGRNSDDETVDAIGHSGGTVSVSVGAVTIDAGSDAEVDINGNDAEVANSTIDIDVQSFDIVAGDDIDFAVNSNDSNGNSSVVDVLIGDVSLDAGAGASVDIEYNKSVVESDDSVYLGEDGDLDTSATVDIELGDLTMIASGTADVTICYNCAAQDESSVNITIADVDMTSQSDASILIEENYASGSDSSVDVTIGDVLMSATSDSSIDIDDNDATNGSTVDITLGDVDLTAGSDADAWLDITYNDAGADGSDSAVSDDAALTITIGTVDLDAGGDTYLYICENDAAGDDSSDSATVDIDIGAVTTNAGSDAWFEIVDNDAFGGGEDGVSVSVTIGDVDITASDDAVFRIYDNNADGSGDVTITLEDVTVNAGNDVAFYVDGVDGSDDGTTTTLGDIVINSGNDVDQAQGDSVGSDVFFFLNDVDGTKTITIDARTVDGESNIEVFIDDAPDLHTVSLSGTNAEVRIFDDVGSDSDDVFTLDLSGMTGTFGSDDGIETYTPKGVSPEADYEVSDPLGGGSDDLLIGDAGVYAYTVEADFDNVVHVKIGTSDLIYNAQHSRFAADGSDTATVFDYSDDDGSDDENITDDWFGSEGWFSLGSDLDLTPEQQVRTLTFGSGGNPLDLTGTGSDDEATFTVDFEGETYVITLDYDGEDWSVIDDGGVSDDYVGDGLLAALGEGAAIDIGDDSSDDYFTVEITGALDGSAVAIGDVSDLSSDTIGGDLTSNLITTEGSEASDGQGNDASEIFQFVGDDIGEIVIGGFRPNGFFAESEVDRLDFRGFLQEELTAADLIITIDQSGDGYFDDVIIDFRNDDYGSIRLVGVGEYFTDANVNGITNSIYF